MAKGYKKTSAEYVHRVVWVAHHGPIPPGFHIHHKNGKKADNRITNLTLVQHGAHISIHQDRRKPKDWRCECGGVLHFAFGLCKVCYDQRYRMVHRETLRKKKAVDYLAKWKQRQATSKVYYLANREKCIARVRARYRKLRAAAATDALCR